MKWFFTFAAAAALLIAAGCQSGSGGGAAKITAESGFQLKSLEVVAFLGLAKGISDEQSVPIMEPIVEDHLMAISPPFILLPIREVEARAAREGARELYKEVTDFWRDRGKVDKRRLEELCAALGVQAIMVGLIEDWTQVEAVPEADQQAYTRVAASLSIYPAETGRRAWRARCTETVEAEGYGASMVSSGDQESGRGRSGGSKSAGRGVDLRFDDTRRSGWDPPRFEDVVPKVAKALAVALSP